MSNLLNDKPLGLPKDYVNISVHYTVFTVMLVQDF